MIIKTLKLESGFTYACICGIFSRWLSDVHRRTDAKQSPSRAPLLKPDVGAEAHAFLRSHTEKQRSKVTKKERERCWKSRKKSIRMPSVTRGVYAPQTHLTSDCFSSKVKVVPFMVLHRTVPLMALKSHPQHRTDICSTAPSLCPHASVLSLLRGS